MKLCLGTAQLSMNYGINNKTMIDQKEPKRIIDEAIRNGITTFDTAAGYNDAESILGTYFLNTKDSSQIITKCYTDPGHMEDSIKASLTSLKQYKIYGLLLHNAEQMYDNNQVNMLIEIKKKNYTDNIGVSVYNPEDACFAANQAWVDIIQIPYNLLDQRLNQTDFFLNAKQKGKIIFARSILLQGLLAMTYEEVLSKMNFAAEPIKKYEEILKKYGLSFLEASVGYVKNNKYIDYLIFGVDNYKQLESFVSVYNSFELPEDCVREIKQTFRNVDKRVISPNLW